jgi:D-alanine transaminase
MHDEPRTGAEALAMDAAFQLQSEMPVRDLVYLNGSILPRAEARVSVEDRGFLFGDGVYEVLRAVRGRLFAESFHNERLDRSLKGIRITLPEPLSARSLVQIASDLLRENGLTDGEATVYMQVTRGVATRSHAYPSPPVMPSIYISVVSFKPMVELKKTGTAAVTQPDIRWGRCDLKTLNLLPNVMAAQYAAEQGAFESVLIRDGHITEGSRTNVFGVVGGALRTHPCNSLILPGITRSVVESLCAELKIELDQTPIATEEIPRLREMFLSGTTTDVMPIVKLDGRPVGDGKPGELTRRLQKILSDAIYSGAD